MENKAPDGSEDFVSIILKILSDHRNHETIITFSYLRSSGNLNKPQIGELVLITEENLPAENERHTMYSQRKIRQNIE